MRPLHDRRGPQEARNGFLGVDALFVVDVAVVARLDTDAVAGAVDIDETLVVDFGVFGDALVAPFSTAGVYSFVSISPSSMPFWIV